MLLFWGPLLKLSRLLALVTSVKPYLSTAYRVGRAFLSQQLLRHKPSRFFNPSPAGRGGASEVELGKGLIDFRLALC